MTRYDEHSGKNFTAWSTRPTRKPATAKDIRDRLSKLTDDPAEIDGIMRLIDVYAGEAQTSEYKVGFEAGYMKGYRDCNREWQTSR